MIGARVGNWYLESELGRGALGSVYRARAFDTSGDSPTVAAVKVLSAAATQDPAFLQRFTGEMLGLQRLDHVNIAKFYDSGTHGGLAFFACELVQGDDFAKLLEGGKRPWREALSVAVQLARALKHGHNRNLLHRDLKPAHVMLTPDGTVKVLAFGVAKVVLPPPPSAAPVLGSAAYLPPETATGKPPTRRSDFYSLGGVLYTLITGRPPFAAATAVELIHKQCYALPERPALLVPDLPPEIDEFVCTLLDKSPARRPGTAAAVLEELERIRGKLERKGETVAWPAKLQPDTAETPTLAAALAGAAVGASHEADDSPRPLMKRPLVVLPLFLLVVGVLIAAFTWPRPTAADLHAAAVPLMASDDPADWEKAWDQYLYPLSQKFPGKYDDDVARARQKVQDRREQRRVLADGAKVDPRTDAERFYLRGLRLAHAGDADAARAVWKAVAAAFAGVPTERRWVELSNTGLAALEKAANNPGRAPPDRAPFEAALAWAKDRPPAERDAALAALEELYRDDPPALAAVRAAKPK